MSRTILEIDRLAKELKELLPMKAENQQKLDKKMRLEFNYNSNHMEGNTLTYSETELLLIFDDTKGNHTLREYEEMKGHDVAYKLILEWAKDKERPLTETNIKELNEILLVRPFWKDAETSGGVKTRRIIKVGSYKEFPNSVRLQNSEMFHYASPEETPIQMGELMEWYRNTIEKTDIHPVEIAAMFHYKFVCIHPFDDGNGRISRLLMNYVLAQYHLPQVIIRSEDKGKYLKALNSADTGNQNDFIEFIAQQLLWSLEISIKAAKGESIEEIGDIEKEIAVWKRNVLPKKPTLKKSGLLIADLYFNCFKDLFDLFQEKHKIFHDLFLEIREKYYIIISNIQQISEPFEELDKFLIVLSNDLSNGTLDNFNTLTVAIFLEGYKYNNISIFNLLSDISIQFEDLKYVMVRRGDVLLEKKYSEYLTTEEITNIVNICIKDVFEEIKQKSEESNL